MGIFRSTAASKNPSCSEWSRPFGCCSLTDAKSLLSLHTLVDDVLNPSPRHNWIKLFDPEADKCSSFALNFWQKHLLWHFLLSYATLNLICRYRWNYLNTTTKNKYYLNRKKNVCGSIRFSVEQWAFQGLSSKSRVCGNLSTSLIHLTLLFPVHGDSCFLSSITVHVEKPPTLPQYRFVGVAQTNFYRILK